MHTTLLPIVVISSLAMIAAREAAVQELVLQKAHPQIQADTHPAPFQPWFTVLAPGCCLRKLPSQSLKGIDCFVFCLFSQLKSQECLSGTGLDFSAASAVVFVELPQEVALVRQAEDRAHRHGQKLSVNVYFLVAKGTSDERRCCTIASSSLHVHCQARCVGPEHLAQVATARISWCLSTTASSSLQMHCQAHCVVLEYLAQNETSCAALRTVLCTAGELAAIAHPVH